MVHGDVRVGKWKGNWRMEWVASTLHTISEHGVSSITTADVHNSAASNRLNWRPRRFKWTRPFRRKTKSGFCTCAITFQLAFTSLTRVVATLFVLLWCLECPGTLLTNFMGCSIATGRHKFSMSACPSLLCTWLPITSAISNPGKAGPSGRPV